MNFLKKFSELMRLISKDLYNAKWAICFLIAYFAFLNLCFGSFCPFAILTGYPCPGCGLTRAGISLLTFHFKEALLMNPMIYGFLILVIVFTVERYIKKDNHYRWSIIIAIIFMIIATFVYIWRLYHWFPNIEPMVYKSHNIINSIMHMK